MELESFRKPGSRGKQQAELVKGSEQGQWKAQEEREEIEGAKVSQRIANCSVKKNYMQRDKKHGC